MRPGGNERGANVALRPTALDAMPRQFGPIRRAPCARTSARSRILSLAPFLADLGEARRDDAQRARPAPERLLGRLEHVLARDADHDEVELVVDLVERPVAAHGAHRLAAAVDRVRGAAEAAGEDVAEQLAADRPPSRRRTDDGDGARREERCQRGDDADVVAFVDALPVAHGGLDREPDLDHAGVERSRAA